MRASFLPCFLLVAGLSSVDAVARQAPPTDAKSDAEPKAPSAASPSARKFASPKSLDRAEPVERRFTGQLQTGDAILSDGSFADMYEIDLAAGDRLSISLSSAEFDPYLILFRVTNEGPESVFQRGGSEGSVTVAHVVGDPGRHLLCANSASPGGTGLYEMIATIAPGAGGTPEPPQGEVSTLEFGVEVNAALGDGDSLVGHGQRADLYQFEGAAGELVEIRLESDAIDSMVFLGLDGEVLAEDDDSGGSYDSLLRYRLPESGRYQVVATSAFAGESGPYRLVLRRISIAEEASGAIDFAARYPGGGPADGRYALLVGIDQYPIGLTSLGSCVADARRMQRLLVERLGYAPENIVMILDADATREHVMEAFARHLGQAGPAGEAMFYFSGHGVSLSQNAGWADPESDGTDEAICTWGEGRFGSIILDDELAMLMRGLAAGAKVAILDSCHSGTASLGYTGKAISLKDETVAKVLRLPSSLIVDETMMPDAGETVVDHLLLAACRDDETAIAMQAPSPSVFTLALTEELDSGGLYLPVEDLMKRVQARVRAFLADELRMSHSQNPRLEMPRPVGPRPLDSSAIVEASAAPLGSDGRAFPVRWRGLVPPRPPEGYCWAISHQDVSSFPHWVLQRGVAPELRESTVVKSPTLEVDGASFASTSIGPLPPAPPAGFSWVFTHYDIRGRAHWRLAKE